MRSTLKKPGYLILTIVLTVAFFLLYAFFDSREGGLHTTLWTTHVRPISFYIQYFGPLYVTTCIVLDILTSFLSALLLAVSIDNYRNGSSMFAGTACSTGAVVILGISTFGCPGCVMPIVGTFGAIFFAKVLPLFGIEFKLVSLLIVVGTFFWLRYRLHRGERSATTTGMGMLNS
jgi:hypothetical protein